MKFLYNAYACEQLDEEGKVLLPGYPAQPGVKRLEPGAKLHVELADGTLLQTVLVKTRIMTFAESARSRFLRAVSNGFYCALEVPGDFDAPGIELGAKVLIDDSPTAAA